MTTHTDADCPMPGCLVREQHTMAAHQVAGEPRPRSFRQRLAGEAGVETRLRLALVELDRDPHNFSSRPCPTCDPIAELLGEPFGCDRFRRTGRQSRIDGLFAAGGGPEA